MVCFINLRSNLGENLSYQRFHFLMNVKLHLTFLQRMHFICTFHMYHIKISTRHTSHSDVEYIVPLCIVLYHTVSNRIVLCRFVSYDILLYEIVSYRFVLYHVVSYQTVFYCIVWY